MRRAFAGLVFILAGCSSATLPNNTIEGGPGQDISVAIAGVENSELPLDRLNTRAYRLQIEVSNNSDHPVTVTRISVAPAMQASAFQLQHSSATFNEMIDPGEDHVFDLRLEGRLLREFRPEESRTVEFRVMVSLSSEETYFYTFEGPIRY